MNKLITELYLNQMTLHAIDEYLIIHGHRNNPNSLSLFAIVNFMFKKGWEFITYAYNGDYIEIIFKDIHLNKTKMC